MVGKRIITGIATLTNAPQMRTWCGAFFGLLALFVVEGKAAEDKTEGNAQHERKQDPLLQLIRALTPDQKAKLMESIKTWQQLGPELKATLRARDKVLRKSLNDEIQAALEGSSFTKEQKEAFEKRYKEERKKLESNLRTEFEARRKTALEELVTTLKKSVAQGESQ
jgi:hypothetical protein